MLRPVTTRASARRRRTSATHFHRFFLALLATVAVSAASSVAPMNAEAAGVYWGSYIKGDTYGYGDAPWDTRSIDVFESHAGKRTSIIHWGQAWYWGSRGGYQSFQRDMAEKVRLRGSIPMITWTSADQDKGNSTDQSNFQLSDISNGQHDAYIRQWARDAKAWGHPLFVRFDHEMNGAWFNWSETKNGNSKGQFAPMWRHVVDIFRQEGASNVTWVWAPNRTWSLAPVSISEVYPGATYVDWAGTFAYNWDTSGLLELDRARGRGLSYPIGRLGEHSSLLPAPGGVQPSPLFVNERSFALAHPGRRADEGATRRGVRHLAEVCGRSFPDCPTR